MGLETATYIGDLNTANPTGTDPKSQGDDHIRLLKSTVRATFPNITGQVTPTHTELNYVHGVTSGIQTQIDSKGAIAGQAWTGDHTFPTQAAGDSTTKAATTAFVDMSYAAKASPTFTGTPTAPTAPPGTNTTQIATTAFATQLAFQAALPAQGGETGKFLQTDGSVASWQNLANLAAAKSANYTVQTLDRYKAFDLTSAATLSLPAAATAGDGFIIYVRDGGPGAWIIDPNASETIDGAATLRMRPNESFAMISDGSNWRTFGRNLRWTEVDSYAPLSSDGQATFAAIGDYDDLMVIFEGVTHGGTGIQVQLGDATPTYVGSTTFASTIRVNGALHFPGARMDYGHIALVTGVTAMGSSPAVEAGTAGAIIWRITGGVRAIRLLVSGGSGVFGGAGTIRLLGR